MTKKNEVFNENDSNAYPVGGKVTIYLKKN